MQLTRNNFPKLPPKLILEHLHALGSERARALYRELNINRAVPSTIQDVRFHQFDMVIGAELVANLNRNVLAEDKTSP